MNWKCRLLGHKMKPYHYGISECVRCGWGHNANLDDPAQIIHGDDETEQGLFFILFLPFLPVFHLIRSLIHLVGDKEDKN